MAGETRAAAPANGQPPARGDAASGASGSPVANGAAGAPPDPPAMLTEPPSVEPSIARLLSGDDVARLHAAPVGERQGRLVLAMLDPSDWASADEASMLAGRPVAPVAIAEPAFRALVQREYGTTAAAMAANLGQAGDDDEMLANLESIEAEDLHRMAEQPSLINLVNLVILEAIRLRASDVHVEPFERDLKVKYRIDGVLVEQDSPPKRLQPAITSRVKIMAGMNIAERYAPQDGHITLRFDGRKIDIRVSTAPTIYGESIVMRVLDKQSLRLDLETLGMREEDRGEVDRLIAIPHGMVLVTGPTGSGKTTTLYAALSKLYDPRKKIITIEDPVEYELEGVNQIPVNPKRGLSFASGLRSILRQDPDVIMVGEIRDGETAEISVRAAMTGHLILSTLHTNDAASAVGRMLDMGIEPFLLASVLEAAIAQRLGRRLAPKYALPHEPLESEWQRLTPDERALFADATGQPIDSHDAGPDLFQGRIGFYEVLTVTRAMRAAITERMNAQQLLRTASADHITMRQDGLRKAARGLTTVGEVLRATQDAVSESAGDGPAADGAR
ncbi:MAG: GspE/PulE family protein [Planctomycetota bacterium]